MFQYEESIVHIKYNELERSKTCPYLLTHFLKKNYLTCGKFITTVFGLPIVLNHVWKVQLRDVKCKDINERPARKLLKLIEAEFW